jgi:Na+/H+ antiporter NhaD/arsenite permease-like protein
MKFAEYAKAYASLIGALCAALLGVYAADTTVGQVLTVVSVIATALATWAIPNTPASGD